MFYASKNKGEKLSSIYSSIPNSPTQTDASMKKKMFARKPAYAVGNIGSQRKKSILQNSSNNLPTMSQQLNLSRNSLGQAQYRELKPQQRTTDSFPQEIYKKQEPMARYRETFYSPKSVKCILFNNSAVLQRKSSKNHTEYNLKESQQNSKRGSFAYRKEKFNTLEAEDDKRGLKLKTNSVQSFAQFLKSSNSQTKKSIEGSSMIDNSLSVQCSYCLNNKMKSEIMQQKYNKLQEQYKMKIQLIKQLSNKCDSLARQKTQLLLKLQIFIDKLQTKEEQLFKMSVEANQRIDSYKKDILRLTQANRYNQIQKSMLLRYKIDYQNVIKECDRLKYENDQYKKQLITYANRQHGYSQHSTLQKRPSSKQPFSKKNQGNNIKNIYYDCQDDAVSLNFSQQSNDYV